MILDCLKKKLALVKSRANELAILEASMDKKDLAKKILDGLDDKYKKLVQAIKDHEIVVTLMELHEKMLNLEASLQAPSPQSFSFLVIANLVNRNATRWCLPIVDNNTMG